MPEFKCNKCKKIFNRKYHLIRHKDSLIDCKTGSKNNRKPLFKCKQCKKEFSRKDNLLKHLHLKRCKNTYKKHNHHNDKSINKTTNKYIDKSTDNSTNKTMDKSNNNKNIDKSTISNNNNNTYHINLVLFAKDGVKNLTYKDLCEILNSNKNLFESMILNINLNPNKPEHHNIYYGDTKSAYGEVYEDNKWIRKKIDEVLNTLLDAKIDDLNEILEDMNAFLSEATKQMINEAIDNVDYRKIGRRKKLISYLKPVIYNNRDMILKTRKLTK